MTVDTTVRFRYSLGSYDAMCEPAAGLRAATDAVAADRFEDFMASWRG